MKGPVRKLAVSIVALVLGTAVCSHRPEVVAPGPARPLGAVSAVDLDTTHKEEPRLVPVEAYLRTYLALFGGLAPIDVQKKARGADGALLFDAWDDYLAALGLPDYRIDLPRGAQTNAVMLAAFDRLGAALCARALEHDWGNPPVPIEARLVFAFDPGSERELEEQRLFAQRFDVLHRTFLGYPARFSPTDRVARYHRLFQDTLMRRAAKNPPKPRRSPVETGWLVVCEGLVRHPEIVFY